jgi:hypothetical protein
MICCLSLNSYADTLLTVEQIRAAYQTAQENTGDIDRANALVDRYVKNHPYDLLGMVYKGSLTTLQARQAWQTWRKLSLINEGFNLLDKSIAGMKLAGSTLSSEQRREILMVSGLTNAAVPKGFGRRPMAERDLGQLIEEGGVDSLSRKYQATVLASYAIAIAGRSAAKAQIYLNKARVMDVALANKIWIQR